MSSHRSDEPAGDQGPGRPKVGRTGARFPSAAQIRRWEEQERQEQAAKPPEKASIPTVAQPTRPRRVTPAPPVAKPTPVGPVASSVRPYIHTGGRTRAGFYLGVETLVSTRRHAPAGMANMTHRAIMDLCDRPKSVAEVAALIPVPLGVARVLIGDLAQSGALFVHRPPTANGQPDTALMARVLRGLQRL